MIRFNLSIKSPCCKLLVSVFKNLNQFVLHKNLNGQNTDRFPFFLSFFDSQLAQILALLGCLHFEKLFHHQFKLIIIEAHATFFPNEIGFMIFIRLHCLKIHRFDKY